MTAFEYKARDKTGHQKKGIITADTKSAATAALRERELTPLSLSEKKPSVMDVLNDKLKELSGVPMKDKVVFTRQLSAIINAGIPLVQALRLIQEQTSNMKLKDIIAQVLSDIQSGATFADALMKHPDVFSDLFINIVKAGEVSGTLDTSLESLAEQMQKDHEVQSKIKGAMILPGLVIMVVIGVVILMSVAVIPSLSDLFEEAGASLPLPTKVMMWMSDFFINYWWLAIMLTVGTVVGLGRAVKTEQGKKAKDALILRAPVFGNLTQLVIYARVTRVLALLLQSGVPLLKGMEIVGALAGNEKYCTSLKGVAKKIEIGVPFADAIREEGKIYPTIIPQMIGIGEQTGALDNMLMRLATIFDNDVQNIIKNLTTLLEPLLMMIMGGAVGFIVMAVLMPIYNLVNVVQ